MSLKTYKFLFFVLMFVATPAAAQFTTVSGTVTDPNGLPYSNGTISFKLVPTTASPTLSGLPYSPPIGPAQLDSAGSFTIRLADNNQLSPAGTQWQFTVCGVAIPPPLGFGGAACFTAASITITGASQNITTQLNAVAVAQSRVGGGAGSVISVDGSAGTGVETLQSGSIVAITSSGTVRGSAQVNNQIGTSYTIVTGDRGKLLTISNAAAVAVTLPQAGVNFPNGWYLYVQNRGAGTVTVTPTTSTIDGATSLALTQNLGAFISSDGTNYFTARGMGAATVTSVFGRTGAVVSANNDYNFSQLAGLIGLAQTPLTTRGDLLTVNATPSLARLPLGSVGLYPRSNGTDVIYSTVAAGGAGSCTNQVVAATSDNAPPTCITVSSTQLATANKNYVFTYVILSPIASLTNLAQHKAASAATLQRISCSTDQGTIDINIDMRAEGTPNTAGANGLSAALTCTTSTAVSTTFATPSISANQAINLQLTNPVGAPNVVRVHVQAQIN